MSSFAEKLANVVSRHDEISALLSSPDVGADDLVRMNKELAALTPVVEAIHEYNHAEKNMADAKAMMDDSSLDKEMREMAEAEFYELKEKLPERNIILIYDVEYPQSIAAKEFQKFLKEKEM